MSEQIKPSNEQEPLIPPRYLLILSALGFLVALIVAATQPEFGVVGYGGLAFGILALLMWVLLAPDQARGVLTGRTARFGGTSLLVTVLLIAVLIGIYAVVRNANLRVDLTQTDKYSLTPESQQAIAALAAEPGTPNVKIVAFYGPAQAGSRDQDSLLFEDYKQTSNGKITYEFVDPEQQPQTVSQYGISRAGQIAVVKLNDDGSPDTQNAQIVNTFGQGDITNAILKVSSSGVFNAYFLTVNDGMADKMTVLKQNLTDRYGWNVQDVSLTELTSPDGKFNLDDPNVTGQVIVIPGGSAPLADAELQVLEDYVNKGGDLIILAGTNLNDKQTSLATGDNLSSYLMQNFGLQFDKNVVIDQTQAFQSPLLPVTTNLSSAAYITTNGVPSGQGALVFEVPNSITISDTPPANVTVTKLATTTSAAYAKTDLQAVLDNNIDQTDSDAKGPFVLAAQAVNSDTGARIVLLGSTSLGNDTYAQFQNIDNLAIAFNSFIWTTNFNDYFTQITVQQQQRPQDQPLFADQQTLQNINFISIFVLPFGVLAIGMLVWWNNRERAR